MHIKILALATWLALVLTNTAAIVEAEPVTKIRIGISSALTGEAAAYGLDIRDAALFAQEEFGPDRFELIIEDDKCSGKEAVTIAKKFVSLDKVDYVIGFSCSGAALSAAPVYEQARVPVVATCASSPKISTAGEYIFRTTPSDILAAQRLYKHVKDKHKAIGVLSEETDYAQDLKQSFIESDRYSSQRFISEDFLPGTSDFKPQLLRLKRSGVEALFVNTQAEAAFANIVRQLDEIQWKIQLYGAYWPGSPAFLSMVGTGGNGIEFVDTPSLDFLLNEVGNDVFERFLKRYPAPRSIESVFASTYEAFRVIDAASKQDKDFRSFLHSTTFDGIFGPYRFDKNGDILGMDFMIKKIVDGKVVPLETF